MKLGKTSAKFWMSSLVERLDFETVMWEMYSEIQINK